MEKILIINTDECEFSKEDKTRCPQFRVMCEETGETVGFLSPMKGLCIQLSPDLKASKAWAQEYGREKLRYTSEYEMKNLIEKCMEKFIHNRYGEGYSDWKTPGNIGMHFIYLMWKQWSKEYGY